MVADFSLVFALLAQLLFCRSIAAEQTSPEITTIMASILTKSHTVRKTYKVSYCSIQVPEIPRWFLQMLANGPSGIATRCLSYAGGKVPATTANVINGQFLDSKVKKNY